MLLSHYVLVFIDVPSENQGNKALKTPHHNMQKEHIEGETSKEDAFANPSFDEEPTWLSYTRRQETVAEILANIVLRMLRTTPSKSDYNETQNR